MEAAVERQSTAEAFRDEFVEVLGAQLRTDLGLFEARMEIKRAQLKERVTSIRRERYKWADKAMEAVVPSDIAREKQQV